MSQLKCNYARVVTSDEKAATLCETQCSHCGVSAKELLLRGEHLEVCGDEFFAGLADRDRVLTPIALCPECHRHNHEDADHHHNPCQVRARRSREFLS